MNGGVLLIILIFLAQEVIISEETFDTEREILKFRAKVRCLGTEGKGEKFSSQYALNRFIECGFCGCTLTR